MDDGKVISELQRISPLVQRSPQLDSLNPDCAKFEWILNQRVDDKDPYLLEFEQLLFIQDDLAPFREGFLRRSPSGSQSVKLRDVAHWMIAQAKLRDPSSVISDFTQFLLNNSVTMFEVRAIWGLHPAEEIELHDSISLCLLESLPKSQPKDQLFGIRDTLLTEGTSFPQPRPKGAITRKFSHTPILAPQGLVIHDNEKTDRIEEIKQALVLLSKYSIAQISSWYQCDVRTPIIGGVLGWSGHALEHAFASPIPEQSYESDSTRNLVQSFLSLDPRTTGLLEVPLDRLNRAKRVSDLRTLAIELGIALEATLTTGSERGSIAYKIRQRGAIILGSDSEKKRYIFNLLKKVYSLRSMAVHGGDIPEEIVWQGRKTPTRTILQEGVDYCSEIIRIIVQRGQFPDWDGLILGW
jgi:hypothetical protein